MTKRTNQSNWLKYCEFSLLLLPPLIPLFLNFPYRINLFLAWDGAYRMSEGLIPYKDFGTPVGYIFWIIPALFFKLFGPYVFTLIKAQVFINLISNFSFRFLLKSLGLVIHSRLIVLLVYISSYTLFNFWPWYNHLVFVLELVSICCLIYATTIEKGKYSRLLIATLSSFISICAFLTKQDTGFLCIVAVSILSTIYSFHNKDFVFLGSFILGLFIGIVTLILPFNQYQFGYWFNLGQYPHNSRFDLFDLINEFLGASHWIKFYFLVFVIILIHRLTKKGFKIFEKEFLISFIVLFALFQASIIQVTSYTPTKGNIYFHSFAIAFILFHIQDKINFKSPLIFLSMFVLTGLWWSGSFWTRFLSGKVKPYIVRNTDQDLINKNSYIVPLDTLDGDRSDWKLSNLATFKKIKLPQSTIDGIYKIKDLTKQSENVKVLNMSELTQLAYEIPYSIEKGENIPLWYHKGVSFFDREVERYCDQIQNKEFDLVLFEVIPDLNNFYPEEVRNCIKNHYTKSFEFKAPRIPEISTIEVYVKP